MATYTTCAGPHRCTGEHEGRCLADDHIAAYAEHSLHLTRIDPSEGTEERATNGKPYDDDV